MNLTLQLLCLAAVVIGYVFAAPSGKLPPSFDVCPAGPKFDQCVERAIEKALKSLVKGYAPLGIYSVDPLEITSIDIDQGSGPVSVNLKFMNLLITGISNAKISGFKSDLKNLVFSGKAFFPKVLLNGPYTINGKVLILPITGDGKSKLTLDDVSAEFIILGEEFKKDGQTFMRVKSFDFIINMKKLDIQLTNLFRGDKALGDNMNKFLNENSQEILKELKPAIQQAFGAAFRQISNRIFNKVPFDEIFPK